MKREDTVFAASNITLKIMRLIMTQATIYFNLANLAMGRDIFNLEYNPKDYLKQIKI